MPTMRSVRIEQKDDHRSSGDEPMANPAHSDAESSTPKHTDWSPNTHELMIMMVLSLVSLMVSLDACIIVTSIAVSYAPLLVPALFLTHCYNRIS